MRKLTDEQVIEQYQQRFGEPLYIPCQFGQGAVSYEMLMRCARIALTEGQAIDWSRYCAPLPDGADS